MDIEKILKEIGVGRYQIAICVALCMSQMFSNLSPMVFIFTAFDVNYRCAIPECEATSSDVEFQPGWLPNASPFETSEPNSKCLRYAPRNQSSAFTAAEETCPSTWFQSSKVIECSPNELVFETKEKTIVNEFGLFCEGNRWKILMVGTANSIGQFFGLPVSGVISDKFGRKNALIITSLLSAICGGLQSYSTDYLSFVLLEGLNAFVSVGLFATALILAVELLYAKRRTLASGMLCSTSPLMGVILALIHQHTEDWRLTLRYCYFPGLLFVAYYWLVPESIRWMSFHGQHDKVIKLLNSLAEKNNVTFSESTKIELAKRPKFEDGKSMTEAFIDILRRRELVFRFLVNVLCWIFVTYIYYGMSIQLVAMSENKYLDFIIMLTLEIPGVPLSNYMLERFGRKVAISSMYILATFALLLYVVVPADANSKLIIFLMAKILISMAFNSLYVHTVEIYPTELRQSLLNLCSMVGKFGFILAVVNLELGAWWKPLPILLFATTSFISAIAIFASPETQNRKLPDTVQESADLEKTER